MLSTAYPRRSTSTPAPATPVLAPLPPHVRSALPELPPVAAKVYLAILANASPSGCIAASADAFAAYARLSRRSIWFALSQLEKAHLLQRLPSSSTSGNRYQLLTINPSPVQPAAHTNTQPPVQPAAYVQPAAQSFANNAVPDAESSASSARASTSPPPPVQPAAQCSPAEAPAPNAAAPSPSAIAAFIARADDALLTNLLQQLATYAEPPYRASILQANPRTATAMHEFLYTLWQHRQASGLAPHQSPATQILQSEIPPISPAASTLPQESV